MVLSPKKAGLVSRDFSSNITLLYSEMKLVQLIIASTSDNKPAGRITS